MSTNCNVIFARRLTSTLAKYNLRLTYNPGRKSWAIEKPGDINMRRAQPVMAAERISKAIDLGLFACGEDRELWLQYRNNSVPIERIIEKASDDDNDSPIISYADERIASECGIASIWPQQLEDADPVMLYADSDFDTPLDDKALMAHAHAEAKAWASNRGSFSHADEIDEVVEWCDAHHKEDITEYQEDAENRAEALFAFFIDCDKQIQELARAAQEHYAARNYEAAKKAKRDRVRLIEAKYKALDDALRLQRIIPVLNIKAIERDYGGFDAQIAALGMTVNDMVSSYGDHGWNSGSHSGGVNVIYSATDSDDYSEESRA